MSDKKSSPATKADLKNLELATQAEIKKLATKAELKALDSRAGRLEDITKNMALDMVRMRGDIDDIKERMATKDDINRILGAIDAFAGEARDYRRKDLERGQMMMKHDDKLQDHENRLTTLETK